MGLNVPKLSHRTPPAFTFPGAAEGFGVAAYLEGGAAFAAFGGEAEREIRRDARRKVVISSAADPYGREVPRRVRFEEDDAYKWHHYAPDG